LRLLEKSSSTIPIILQLQMVLASSCQLIIQSVVAGFFNLQVVVELLVLRGHKVLPVLPVLPVQWVQLDLKVFKVLRVAMVAMALLERPGPLVHKDLKV
jgi:hypothetical protein